MNPARRTFTVVVIGLGILALLPCQRASAEQAAVRSYEQPDLDIGQAFLAHHGDRCLGLLPMHVAREAIIPAVLKEGTPGLLGEAMEIADLGDDLAMAWLGGAVASDCGYGLSTLSRAVDRHVRKNGLAVLRSINGDGTAGQLAVTIIDDDGERLLRIQPTNSDSQIRKGQSGSMLLVGDVPVGMLLSVHARSGIGTVMRLDRMIEKAEAHLANALPLVGSGNRTEFSDGGPAPVSTSGSQVVAWNVMPVDALHRPLNLTDPNQSLPWIADVPRWPVVIEIAMGGGKQAIGGVRFDSAGVDTPGALPAYIEISINVSAQGRQWRSITSGELRFENGAALVAFAPVWVRQLRLLFAGAADGGNRIALGKIITIPAD